MEYASGGYRCNSCGMWRERNNQIFNNYYPNSFSSCCFQISFDLIFFLTDLIDYDQERMKEQGNQFIKTPQKIGPPTILGLEFSHG